MKLSILIILLGIYSINAQASPLENELTYEVNRLIRNGLGLSPEASVTEFEGRKIYINTSIEHNLQEQGRFIIAALFEIAIDGKYLSHLTSGAIGIGESFEDSKLTLLNEWVMQFGIPLVNYFKGEKGFPFKDFTVYTGPTGFRGESPGGWIGGTDKLHTTILETIGIDMVLNSTVSPVTITLTITVSETGKFDSECRLNGQVSKAISEKLKKVEWPTSKTGYMLKQFYLLAKTKAQP